LQSSENPHRHDGFSVFQALGAVRMTAREARYFPGPGQGAVGFPISETLHPVGTVAAERWIVLAPATP